MRVISKATQAGDLSYVIYPDLLNLAQKFWYMTYL